MKEIEYFKNLYPTTQLMLFSLFSGTILLILHLLFPRIDEIVMFGIFYVLGLAIVNVFALIHLFFVWSENWRNFEIFIIRTLILLSNIPFALLYTHIVIYHNINLLNNF